MHSLGFSMDVRGSAREVMILNRQKFANLITKGNINNNSLAHTTNCITFWSTKRQIFATEDEKG